MLTVALYCLCIVVWLFPTVYLKSKKKFSLLHPGFIFPILVLLNIFISLSEFWFSWSNRWKFSGIKQETTKFLLDETFYFKPLIVMIISGLFFLLPVILFENKFKTLNLNVLNFNRCINEDNKLRLFIVVLISLMITVPAFFLFGEGSGFFWTVPLLYSLIFLPPLISFHNKKIGLLVLFLVSALLINRGSKGDLLYSILPYLLYILSQNKKISIKSSIVLLVFFITVSFIGIKVNSITRGELELNGQPVSIYETLAKKVIVREYGFEVLSILIAKESVFGRVFEQDSWIMLELKNIIPSFLYPGKKYRASNLVGEKYLFSDYLKMPDCGFYRHYLFPFYHDFGFIGVIIWSFILGSGYMLLYYNIYIYNYVNHNIKYICFFPFLVFSPLIVNGDFPFAFYHIFISYLFISFIDKLMQVRIARRVL